MEFSFKLVTISPVGLNYILIALSNPSTEWINL